MLLRSIYICLKWSLGYCLSLRVDGDACEDSPKNKKHLKVLLFDECKSLYMNIVRGKGMEESVKKKY